MDKWSFGNQKFFNWKWLAEGQIKNLLDKIVYFIKELISGCFVFTKVQKSTSLLFYLDTFLIWSWAKHFHLKYYLGLPKVGHIVFSLMKKISHSTSAFLHYCTKRSFPLDIDKSIGCSLIDRYLYVPIVMIIIYTTYNFMVFGTMKYFSKICHVFGIFQKYDKFLKV